MRLPFFATLLLLSISNYIIAQESINISIDADDNARTAQILSNNNNSSLSAITLRLQSGTSSNQTLTNFTTFAQGYIPSSGYGGYTGLSNFKNGIFLRAQESNANIRFITGGPNLNNTRVLINSEGDVAFGGQVPRTKLHLQGGDLYLDGSAGTVGSKIIMKSSNGNCFTVEIDNSGTLISTPMTQCPTL